MEHYDVPGCYTLRPWSFANDLGEVAHFLSDELCEAARPSQEHVPFAKTWADILEIVTSHSDGTNTDENDNNHFDDNNDNDTTVLRHDETPSEQQEKADET